MIKKRKALKKKPSLRKRKRSGSLEQMHDSERQKKIIKYQTMKKKKLKKKDRGKINSNTGMFFNQPKRSINVELNVKLKAGLTQFQSLEDVKVGGKNFSKYDVKKFCETELFGSLKNREYSEHADANKPKVFIQEKPKDDGEEEIEIQQLKMDEEFEGEDGEGGGEEEKS